VTAGSAGAEPRSVVPRWRSVLFVPATASEGLLAKVHLRGADAVIIDLEDAVSPGAKVAARERVPGIVQQLAGRGPDVLVRVNVQPALAEAELGATFGADVRAIVIPKVEDAGRLWVLSAQIAALEAAQDLPPGTVGMIAMIESPAALARLDDITAVPRVAGLALGSEDFSLALGVNPSPACLTLPCQMLALAAAAHGIGALGLPVSLADYDDLEGYAVAARQARAMGLTGALCVHPTQVPVLNTAFAVSERERAEAERVVAAWERGGTAGGTGVVALDGRMIDLPVAQRARMLLGLHNR
jgi:citrate lyase subunit beta/citryl-CoA lyase